MESLPKIPEKKFEPSRYISLSTEILQNIEKMYKSTDAINKNRTFLERELIFMNN
jgi:hypothetical protein